MSELFSIALNILCLMIVAYAAAQVVWSDLGGVVGKALRLILLGVAVIAITRFVDAVYLSNLDQLYPVWAGSFPVSVVSDVGYFIGFLLIAVGYAQLTAAHKS